MVFDDLNNIICLCRIQCIGKRGIFHASDHCLCVLRFYQYIGITLFCVIRMSRIFSVGVTAEFDEETFYRIFIEVSFTIIIQFFHISKHHYT